MSDKVQKIVGMIEEQGEVFANLKARLDDVEALVNRPAIGGGTSSGNAAAHAHRDKFMSFFRRGEEAGLAELEVRAALSTGSTTDGGYAVPLVIDREIEDRIAAHTPVMELASVVTMPSGGKYRKLVNLRGTTSGWVGETAERPATDTPSLEAIEPPGGDLYAFPQATQWSLDDVFFNVEAWLAENVGTEFGLQLGAAFVSGNGQNKPKGFLDYTKVATGDATRAFGQLQYIATGEAAGFKAATEAVSPADVLIDLVHAMKAGYRSGASWLMNASTAAVLRKWKDMDGAFIWQRALNAGQPDTLLGYPVHEAADMPDIGADSFPIAFGNWKRGYVLVNRPTRVLRDPYSHKPYVGFYTTRRMDGAIMDSQAIKLLKVGVS
jgi:HK97 family phage major capsid protein